MALAQTKAAEFLQENVDQVTPHQVISLLMDGALERTNQAIMAYHSLDIPELTQLMEKLVAIINGLRNSLNLDQGGDIAENLNDLYLYLIERLENAENSDILEALTEAKRIINEVKAGWDSIPSVK